MSEITWEQIHPKKTRMSYKNYSALYSHYRNEIDLEITDKCIQYVAEGMALKHAYRRIFVESERYSFSMIREICTDYKIKSRYPGNKLHPYTKTSF